MSVKRIFFIVFFLCLTAFVVLYVTVDQQTMAALQNIQPGYLLLALVSLSIGWYFDVYRVRVLAQGLERDVAWFAACQVVFSNYFLGVFTPASSGGFLGQLYFLKRAGLLAGEAIAMVLIRTLLSLFCLLLVLPVIVRFDFFSFKSLHFSGLIFFISIALVSLLFFFVAKPLVLQKIGCRLRGKGQQVVAELVQALLSYQGKAKRSLLGGLFYSGVSLFFLYLSVPLLIFSFGFYPAVFKVLGRVALLNFLLYFAPTPGGVGIAEGGLVLLLKDLIPFSVTGIISVFWRLFSEYLPCFVGGLLCLPTLGHYWKGVKKP